jgi:hypothetical protein
MMLQVAGGILIAAFILALICFGLVAALDQDNQNLGVTGRGWTVAAVGCVAAIGIIYVAFTGTI